MAALWARRRHDILKRAETLGDSVRAIGAVGQDAVALRAESEHAAHQLAGTLASFGQSDAARAARDLQLELAAQPPEIPGPAARAVELAEALQAALGRTPVGTDVTRTARDDAGQLLLLVDADADTAEATAHAAAVRGLRTEVAGDLGTAELILATREPDGVLVTPAGDWSGMLAFVERLSRREPAIPALVVAGSTAYSDRLEAVRAGARAVVSPSVPPAEVVGVLESILERERRGGDSLLILDDDPALLELVENLLTPQGLNVTTLDDARRFWQTLEDVRPDLVILDLSMPHADGIELCRVLRADPRWAGLPVIVLTGRDDPESATEAFTVGADDFVAKALVDAELLTRVRNRLERVHLYRELADRDPLTGLANRRKFSEDVSRLIRLADRFQQPLSFVMVDLDNFKQVNDRFGHATGDEVLRRLALVLVDTLRGEDVVGRWGGEEFALVLFGMARADGVQRVEAVLERFRRETFTSPEGATFTVSFSAGVAQLPDDGKDGQLLYQAADEALFRAKSAGRDVVLPAGP